MSFPTPEKHQATLRQLKRATKRKMTAEERFDQKVSFVYGQLGSNSKLTKSQVRKQLLENRGKV